MALAAPVAGLGVVALEDLVRAVAAVPAYGNPVVRPAVAEVAGRAAPAAVEAGALVAGPGRVAGLELVEAEALVVGQEPVAGLEPAVEAAQVGVVAQVEVLVAEAGPEDLAVAGVQVEEAELVEAAAEGALAGQRVPRPGNG